MLEVGKVYRIKCTQIKFWLGNENILNYENLLEYNTSEIAQALATGNYEEVVDPEDNKYYIWAYKDGDGDWRLTDFLNKKGYTTGGDKWRGDCEKMEKYIIDSIKPIVL
jgi:hypothetical protein